MGKNSKIKEIKRLAKVMPVLMTTAGKPLDHAKNMKNLYKAHGAKGVRAYMLNVENHANRKIG